MCRVALLGYAVARVSGGDSTSRSARDATARITPERLGSGEVPKGSVPADSAVRRAAETGTPTPREGEIIGRYRILHGVAEGGMSSVYAAHDPELDRNVAIKVLHADIDEAQLVSEAKALARLAHPNVITVYDVGRVGGAVFVAMELIDGVTLFHWMRESPRVYREILPLFVDAARGLSAAHEAGIVHRDFKPENVLVGRDGRVRVLDFGIATRRHEGDAPDESGTVMGTPAYMAPEQFLGARVDARTDQFSFCVSLWEALYGERPFRADKAERLGLVVCKGELPDVSRRPEAPPWLVRVLARGLSVHPVQRYRTMTALVAEIEAGLARDASGDVLEGRYELIRRVQADTMQRALDRLTGEVVTLRFVGGTSEHEAFARLHALRHPNLVPVLDTGHDERDQQFLVLGLREQPREFLGFARAQPFALQIDLVAQLLRALAYLHRQGPVHGEIGPSSVLVVGQRVVLLPPLSIAKAREGDGVRVDLQAVALLARQLFDASAQIEARALDAFLERCDRGEVSTAAEMLEGLARATERAIAIETPETRESFLRAAPFVGRAAELDRVSSALVATIQGHGGAWLVGGESGVGKSRFLEEVRAIARLAGALVVHGQAETEGASPYALFRDPLRWLAASTTVAESEASVLLPIMPDVATLLGRAITAATRVDAPSMHARLVDTVMAIVRRVARPIVILLEDLHWARSDSLALLRALITAAPDLPLFVVATYRSDEAPDLPKDLGGMELLALGRLDSAAISSLAGSMIGPAARSATLVELLSRESEGNAFFLVEVVRALADRAGSLERVAESELPQGWLEGGVRRVVQRRLRAVPDWTRALLAASAVIGRRVDRGLLAIVEPDATLDSAIDAWTAAAVFEHHDEGLRFAHDKLREGVLADLGAEERAQLHRRVAGAIETTYPDDPARWASLAQHYCRANDAEREAYWSRVAGDHALSNGAQAEGVTLIARALELRASATPFERASLHRRLGVAAFVDGRFDDAAEQLGQALELLDVRLPTSRAGWAFMIVTQLLVYVWLRLTGGRESAGTGSERHLERARAAQYLSLSLVYRLEDLSVLGLGLVAVNESERARKPSPVALAILGFALALAGLRGRARATFDRARAHANAREDMTAYCDTLVVESAFLVSVCDLEQARARLRELLSAAEGVGLRLAASSGHSLLARCDWLTGQFASARDHFAIAIDMLAGYSRAHRVGQEACVAAVTSALGRHDEAWEMLQRCDATSDEKSGRLFTVALNGHRALVAARRGDPETAETAADAAVALTHVPAMPAPCVEMLEAPGEAYVLAWKAALSDERRDDATRLRVSARRQLDRLKQWARVFPIAMPAALLLEARIEALEGNIAAATKTLRTTAAVARARSFTFHEGMAHLELARLSPAGSSERSQSLTRARTLLVATGAEHQLAGDA